MRPLASLGRLLAAVALAAAAAGVGLSAPAAAAGCSSADGVTVVVDFNELGGGVPSVCESGGGGKKASTLFGDAGFPLSYASRQPGFVCRVSGVPASDPCVNTAPANAYWGLWWSDGETGTWTYSSLGAASLTIPDGGYVAFSWDQVDGSASPSFTPAVHRSEPTPSPTPTPTSKPSPSTKPTPSPSGPGTSASAPPDAPPSSEPAPTATSGTSAPPNPGATPASPSASPSGSPSDAAVPPSDVPTEPTEPGDPAVTDEGTRPGAVEPDGDGLPSYVAPALIAVLFAAAGVVFLVRRRPGSP